MIDWQILTEYAKKVSSQDHSGHGFDHIERVVANAKQLVAKQQALMQRLSWLRQPCMILMTISWWQMSAQQSSRPASDGRGRVDAGADSGSDRNY